MHLGIITIVLAGVAGWVAGAGWYGLLGQRWSAALGWTTEDITRMRQASPLVPMLFSFLAELVMALILYVVMGPTPAPHWLHGLIDGVVLWLGFVVTTSAVNYAFQRKSLALLAIDLGHWLLVLVLQGTLISALR